jgi:hypothetical protein
MYKVFYNNKPADCFHYEHRYGSMWSQSEYATWLEANEYANKFLGIRDDKILLTVNKPYDYIGNIIEIRDTMNYLFYEVKLYESSIH